MWSRSPPSSPIAADPGACAAPAALARGSADQARDPPLSPDTRLDALLEARRPLCAPPRRQSPDRERRAPARRVGQHLRPVFVGHHLLLPDMRPAVPPDARGPLVLQPQVPMPRRLHRAREQIDTRHLHCEGCADILIDPEPHQRFCTKQCRERSGWRRRNPNDDHVCHECGGPMPEASPTGREKRRSAKYCSTRCINRAFRRKQANGHAQPNGHAADEDTPTRCRRSTQ